MQSNPLHCQRHFDANYPQGDVTHAPRAEPPPHAGRGQQTDKAIPFGPQQSHSAATTRSRQMAQSAVQGSSSPAIGARGVFGFDLNKPLRGGWLLKQGGSHKAFKKRFFVLYPGFLIYYSSPDKYKYDVARSTLASRLFAIKLKGAETHTAKYPPKGCHFGFTVHAPDPLNKRCGYLFNATDKEDRKAWIIALRGASSPSHKQSKGTPDATAQNGTSKPQEPKDHTQEPRGNTQEPKDHTQEPMDHTQEPRDDTQEPKDDTQEPKDHTQEPRDDTQEPKDDTQEPKDHTQEPKDGTQEPKDDTQEPKDDTQEPKDDTQEPKDHTQEPRDDTQEPKDGTQEPKDDTQEPKDDTQEPKDSGLSNGPSSPKAPVQVHLTVPEEDQGAVTDEEGEEHRAEEGNLEFSDGEDSEEEPGPSPMPSPKHSPVQGTSPLLSSRTSPEPPGVGGPVVLTSDDSDSSEGSPHPVSPDVSRENTPAREVEEGEEEGAQHLEPHKKDSGKRPSMAFTGKQGWLYKQGGKRKTWKQRYFVLSPGTFAYYSNKGGKLQGEVKLKNMQVFFPAIGEREQSYQFTVHTESSWNKRNNYVMAASTEHEMKDWIEAFKLANQRPGQASPAPTRK